jgi:FkbM family methyltransferase
MKLVFDIGYNHGEFSIACTSKHRDCKIIALEANPTLTKEPPVLSNITLINKLVSTDSGKQTPFYVNPAEDGISTASMEFLQNSRFTQGNKYIQHQSRWSHPIHIESTTLTELIKEYGTPDFIKIDVEGFEKEVINGLSQTVPMLGFEWHEEDYNSVIDIVNRLSNLGFEKFGIIGYFEGDIPSEITFSDKGDPYMDFPENFYDWENLKPVLDKMINPERRVHYGMFYAKNK